MKPRHIPLLASLLTVFLFPSDFIRAQQDLAATAAEIRKPDHRPRLLVLTDIGGDPDDQQSMIRLMLYANEFEIEGIIATASGTPGELKEKVTRPDLVREIVTAYGEVHSQLTRHAEGYPPPEQLLGRIYSGNSKRGESAIGEGNDTEGSRTIIQLGDRAEARPLNICIWGGQTDLAQALWRVREDRGESGLKRFLSNVRIYDIADQDDLFEWMNREFDFPFYVLNQAQPGADKREAVFRGMYLGGDESTTSREWLNAHVWSDHGPLGALYPRRTWTAPNPHSAMKEGDTPSWFYFLRNGLNDPSHPSWGGWGGRFMQAGEGIWRDAADAVEGTTHPRATVWRWRPHFQNELAARMDWCVQSFEEANHSPVAVLKNDSRHGVLRVKVKPGEKIRFDAGASIDPDGDALSFQWWQYHEPGSWMAPLELKGASQALLEVTAPQTDHPATAHLILEVTDRGAPPLTSYRRLVLQFTP